MSEVNEKGLEEMFKDLDEIIGKMQTPDITLEDSFEYYKKGLELVKECNNKIEKVECDIKKVANNG